MQIQRINTCGITNIIAHIIFQPIMITFIIIFYTFLLTCPFSYMKNRTNTSSKIKTQTLLFMVQNFNDDDSSNLFLSRTTLNSISHKLRLQQFLIGICLTPSLIKRHRKVFFYIPILCPTPYLLTDFQYLIHQVASCYLQCN